MVQAMRILYGVVGEGMGHAMRSRVVLEHLVTHGHKIEVMASSKAADFLGSRFEGVTKIHGFHIISEKNRIRRSKTCGPTSSRAPKECRKTSRPISNSSTASSPRWSSATSSRGPISTAKSSPPGDQHRQHADHQPLRSPRRGPGRGAMLVHPVSSPYPSIRLLPVLSVS